MFCKVAPSLLCARFNHTWLQALHRQTIHKHVIERLRRTESLLLRTACTHTQIWAE